MRQRLLISLFALANALTAAAETHGSATMSAADGQDPRIHADKSRPVSIPRFSTEPVIDANLTDEVWRSAVILKDFHQLRPNVNGGASQPTEVMLGYDSKHLYVAFVAHDDPQAEVRASLARRDQIFEDDHVRIVLDTFNDKQKAYVFAFNPLGVIADGVFTEGVGYNYDLHIPIRAKGRITGSGYVVEAAIPFHSLKFDVGTNAVWGVNLIRFIKRFNNEYDSWMPTNPNKMGQLSQAGQMIGLVDIFTKPSYEIVSSIAVAQDRLRLRNRVPNPAGLTNGAGDSTAMIRQPLNPRLGFAAKLNLGPSLSVKVAINPGYLAGTEIFRTSTYLQRKREAFDPDYGVKRTRSLRKWALDENYLEGVNNFQTPLQSVSKYAVIDPDYVVEVSGRVKNNTLDLLLVRDPARGDFSPQELEHPQLRRRIERYIDVPAYLNAIRVKRDVGKDSRLGLLATSYNFGDTRSYSAGFDGRVRVDKSSFLSYQVQGVHSERPFFEPEIGEEVNRTGNGIGYYFGYEKQKRNFGFSFSADGRTKYYRADLGFSRRFNHNQASASFRYQSDADPERKVVAWRVANPLNIGYDWEGRLRYWSAGSKVDVDLHRETYLSFSYTTGYERLLEEEYGARRSAAVTGAFVGSSERSTRFHEGSVYGESTPRKELFVSAFASYKRGEFDLDYDAGPRFLRASAAGMLDPDAPMDPNAGTLFYFESSIAYRPTSAFHISLDYSKSRLVRSDNHRIAYDDNTYGSRLTYHLNKSAFFRSGIDYSTLSLRMRGQLLFGLTNSSGKSVYVVYNGDFARAGYGPFFATLAPNFRQNGQTVLVKVSYPLYGNIKSER